MDPIKAYLRDVRKIDLLTAEEEFDLAQRVQKGDKEARNMMIRANLRLVISIAKRYVNLGVPLSDLIEEGNIGLMKSVEKFDPDRGFRFSTYAAWWIKQGISRAIIDQGKLIRVPVYMNEEILKYKKTIEDLTHKLKRKPRAGEIAKRLQVSVDKVRELENSIAKMSSLDAPIGEEGDGMVKDIIEDQSLISPDEQLEVFFNRERALGFLETLNERERKIIDMRFGLTDGNTHTLAEIAKVLSVSRERVRQLEASTIKKIRQVIKNREKGKKHADE
ncbi:MAG: RNA polymerase sigma factor RpoD/SigA [Candidatus Omnitrophota bacterium]|nr:RNA polymerase sigma factor RpoD/SigA [Candidatus Omnitrophota bacterium]MDZ4241295.1 RNA polymerase sigma factor RpoD/SigA [Candidatus Omnitrophota bacterium]